MGVQNHSTGEFWAYHSQTPTIVASNSSETLLGHPCCKCFLFLRRDDLKNLLAVNPPTTLNTILDGLQFVMADPGHGPLRFYHKSLEDFLTDAARCPEAFYVNEIKSHGLLALACFRAMNQESEFDIWHLETSFCRNIDTPGRKARVERSLYLPPSIAPSAYGTFSQGRSLGHFKIISVQLLVSDFYPMDVASTPALTEK